MNGYDRGGRTNQEDTTVMRELLFVGGPAHGRRIMVRDGIRIVRIVDDTTTAQPMRIGDDSTTTAQTTVEYQRKHLVEGDRTFGIMVSTTEVSSRHVMQNILNTHSVDH